MNLTKGLVGHWPLDAENGVKDVTPNGNNGTANGGITIGGTTDRKGKTGGATTFDDTDDYINNGDIQQYPETVSLWFKPDNIIDKDTSPMTLLNLRDYDTGYHTIALGASTNLFSDEIITVMYRVASSFPRSAYGSSTGSISTEWHHLGVVRVDNAENWYIYLDGERIDNKYYHEGKSEKRISNLMWVGARNDIGEEQYFDGKIQDVRVYGRQLSAEEIKLLYDQYKPKEASVGSLNKGLVLDMPLTTKHMKSSTVVSDRTPYGNDGAVGGATVGSQYTTFDGSNDSVVIPHNANQLLTTGGSFSAWIYPRSAGGENYGRIFDKSTLAGGNDGYFVAMWNSSSIGIRINFGDLIQTTLNSVPFNNWTYVTAIWDNSGYVKIYINGVLNVEGQSGSASDITTTNPLTIGNRSTTIDRTFDGKIFDVKIYNRALNEKEIKLLYDRGRN